MGIITINDKKCCVTAKGKACSKSPVQMASCYVELQIKWNKQWLEACYVPHNAFLCLLFSLYTDPS